MDFGSKKLTINGEKFFDNLPQLVQVSHDQEGSGVVRKEIVL
jgi:hypothetical protein